MPGFVGETGPAFFGWTQCEGYFDTTAASELPSEWGDDCTGEEYNMLRLVCGSDSDNYDYIDIDKNVFREGLTGFSELGLVDDASFSGWTNVVQADGGHPHNGLSKWGGTWDCGAGNPNLAIKNFCTYEVANCFGQGLSSSRYLWVYVAP